MRYYMLIFDYNNDENVISCNSEDSFDHLHVGVGKKILTWDPNITLYYDPVEGKLPTDLLGNAFGWLIVSETFKQFIVSFGINDVQFLPINIVNKENGAQLNNYFVMNVYKLVDALDLKKSKYSYFYIDENEKVLSVKVCGLNKEKLQNIHLFKLKDEYYPTFVSEDLKNQIQKLQFSGFDFLETIS